jgi:hypothetical protein
MELIIARMHIECHSVRERNNNIFLRRILKSRATKRPNFKEQICHFSCILYHLSAILSIMNLILTDESIFIEYNRARRDLNGTDRIVWDFISGHLMPHHLVYIYRHNRNMIAVVAVRPNVILGQQYLSSPQIEPSIFVFWENLTYCSKKYSFSISFKLYQTRRFAKGKSTPSNFL